jgi:hypothetical protein
VVLVSEQALNRSVIEPSRDEGLPYSNLVLSMASVADDFFPWGNNLPLRDRQLRGFWPTEPVLASAIYTVVSRNAALSWGLEGPPRTIESVQRMLHSVDRGRGWENFMIKVCTDYLTQDNGAFIEIVRQGEGANSPVIALNHLDAERCRRTGRLDYPVIYTDRMGRMHRMEPHDVIDLVEFPSPIETMNGAQLCAVSRVLRASQILRDISIYKREKVAGNTPMGITIVNGISQKSISDAFIDHRERMSAEGFTRYIKPLVFATTDPNARPTSVEIPLKSLPDGFDEDMAMRWYINQLAMGFGVDYQDFAPLPGRALGSGQQSLILHMKSRGKGPAVFMKALLHAFNFRGILPQNVEFTWSDRDLEEEQETANLREAQSRTDAVYVANGVLNRTVIRRRLLERGEITQEEFDALEAEQLADPAQANPVGDQMGDQFGGDAAPAEKAVGDERAGFAEQARLDAEDALAQDMEQALARVLRDIKKRLNGSKLLRRKEGPEFLFDDTAFQEEMRRELVSAMLPHVRHIANVALDANLSLGLNVDLDRVNREVLQFSSTYTNDWWAKLSANTSQTLRAEFMAWQELGLGDRGLPDFIDAIEPLFGETRAKRIAVTETTRIFDLGNNLAHIAAGVTEEEWQTVRGTGVDQMCADLDGQRFPVDGGPRPVTDTHIGCVAEGTLVNGVAIEGAYRVHYSGPMLELTTEAGMRLSITPNHPVLTDRGWVAAEFLRPGDNVISGGFGEGVVSCANERIADCPTVIEQIFGAFPVVRRELITGTEFHGDGGRMDGYVDIVSADRQLRGDQESSGFQPVGHLPFIGSGIAHRFLVRYRAALVALRAHGSAPARSICFLGKGLTFGLGQFGHALLVGLTNGSSRYAIGQQTTTDGSARNAILLGQGHFGLPSEIGSDDLRLREDQLVGPRVQSSIPDNSVELGQGDRTPLQDRLESLPLPVFRDELVSIRCRQYSGHVYDLQSSMSMYQAAGIVIHNCRCARLPVVADAVLGR